MADRAASVLAKIRNKSKEMGWNSMQSLQLFCQEEFIRRINLSKYKDTFILKGGLLIYALSNFGSRTTRDADFLVENLSNSPEKMREIIHEIINTESENDFVTFELANLKEIAKEKKYTGVSAFLIVKIKNTRTGINIDFGFGDTIIPKPKTATFPVQVEGFSCPQVRVYPVETIIAEKIDAILDRMELSSRMKDYFDIHFILQNFDFDGATLKTAIARTFENRQRNYDMNRFQKVLQFHNDQSMGTKWKAFLKKAKLSEIPFQDVIASLQKFLELPIQACFNNKDFLLEWKSDEQKWV
ncbi:MULTISPECIES: nucleotidyl transferase AbiEii/AbiGii toxin family protein [unclassified Fibrobacter]|uniref:nucleotidyl transferase AbiEii/AbiGii toxin family protein n=1 Tax=unclassified Fibrobacter TaxID=2634177 RepID=UPI0009216945|nr:MULTISPECIES: nucleotidyl transferase AbiEii/AbiGii toxin family protein [Fibrobacter]MCL4103400.1 hypothetical protein [Fibrobacter succinogenes]OWV05564.1 nucleotidyltransferase [Fibrobacter sp. UWH3]SHK46191.1 Nucleotidyl transferase AbiEii toxin, Type IV TA system [Fibrobacter sp. UWH6]